MIDFACKLFDISEIIKCSLNLTKSDLKILEHLISTKNESLTSDEISSNLKIDISTAQRSLKKLRDKNLIIRRQNNLSPGGYVYKYRCQDKIIIKKNINDIISNWSKKVDIELNKWILK